jgi:hypothetical protein
VFKCFWRQLATVAIAFSLALSTRLTIGQEKPLDQFPPEMRKRVEEARKGPHPHPYTSYASFQMIDPIKAEEIDWWSRMLHLHPAQQKELDRLFEQYRAADKTLRDTELQAVYAESAAISALRRTNESESDLRSIGLVDMRDALVKKMLVNEVALLSGLELVIAEQQKPALARVRFLRERIRFGAVATGGPGSRFDLSVMLLRRGLWREFEATDEVVFDQQLQNYERELTELRKEHERTFFNVHRTSMASWAAVGPRPDPADEEATKQTVAREQHAYEEMISLGKNLTDFERRMGKLNSQTARSFAALFPPSIGEAFIAEFLAGAYPAVYPNPFDFGPVLDAASQLSSLDADQPGAIASIAQKYRQAIVKNETEMVERLLARWEVMQATRIFDAEQHCEYKASMSALQSDRRKTSDQTLDRLKGVLTHSQTEELAAAIERFQKRANAHKSTEMGWDFRP